MHENSSFSRARNLWYLSFPRVCWQLTWFSSSSAYIDCLTACLPACRAGPESLLGMRGFAVCKEEAFLNELHWQQLKPLGSLFVSLSKLTCSHKFKKWLTTRFFHSLSVLAFQSKVTTNSLGQLQSIRSCTGSACHSEPRGIKWKSSLQAREKSPKVTLKVTSLKSKKYNLKDSTHGIVYFLVISL